MYHFLSHLDLTKKKKEKGDDESSQGPGCPKQEGLKRELEMDQHKIPIEELFKRYGTNLETGLTDEQAKVRIEENGKNADSSFLIKGVAPPPSRRRGQSGTSSSSHVVDNQPPQPSQLSGNDEDPFLSLPGSSRDVQVSQNSPRRTLSGNDESEEDATNDVEEVRDDNDPIEPSDLGRKRGHLSTSANIDDRDETNNLTSAYRKSSNLHLRPSTSANSRRDRSGDRDQTTADSGLARDLSGERDRTDSSSSSDTIRSGFMDKNSNNIDLEDGKDEGSPMPGGVKRKLDVGRESLTNSINHNGNDDPISPPHKAPRTEKGISGPKQSSSSGPRKRQVARKSSGGGGQRAKLKPLPAASGSNLRKAVPPPSRRRYRPGVKALKEIRKYQKSTQLLIPGLPFSRLIREIAQAVVPHGELRFQSAAIQVKK